MNSNLRARLVAQYGEHKVKEMELTFRPVKIEREDRPKREVVHTKRVSRRVIRRRKEVI